MGVMAEGSGGITAWLCLDCMLSRETGQILEPLRDTQPKPLSLMEDPSSLSRNTCGHHAFDRAEHCTCIRTFDDTPCPGCGSTLAGSRYRYVDWSIL